MAPDNEADSNDYRAVGSRDGPAGLDKARRRRGTPPRAGTGAATVDKPEIPDGVTPDLPRRVMGELRRHARDADAVARALTVATDLVDSGQPEAALDYLTWAKQDAPRSPSVREALGIALYRSERWQNALTELQAYRRLDGRQDQNHLIADCLRALGRSTSKVADAVAAMDPEADGADRVAEGVIVWAATLADRGDLDGARRVLSPVISDTDDPALHEVRVWYVAGDLAERAGDTRTARQWFGRVAALDADFYDVSERLDRLG